MSRKSSPPLAGNDGYPKGNEKFALGEPDVLVELLSVGEGEDVLALQDVDPALNAKMHIVNNVR